MVVGGLSVQLAGSRSTSTASSRHPSRRPGCSVDVARCALTGQAVVQAGGHTPARAAQLVGNQRTQGPCQRIDPAGATRVCGKGGGQLVCWRPPEGGAMPTCPVRGSVPFHPTLQHTAAPPPGWADPPVDPLEPGGDGAGGDAEAVGHHEEQNHLHRQQREATHKVATRAARLPGSRPLVGATGIPWQAAWPVGEPACSPGRPWRWPQSCWALRRRSAGKSQPCLQEGPGTNKPDDWDQRAVHSSLDRGSMPSQADFTQSTLHWLHTTTAHSC